MSQIEYRIERRARLLADAMTARVKLLANFLRPDSARPPFTEQESRREALAWWQKHRFDQFGEQILATMTPNDILALDNALARANEEEAVI